eukprot:1376648-Amorphochlora_amoeboformis.AAC.2
MSPFPGRTRSETVTGLSAVREGGNSFPRSVPWAPWVSRGSRETDGYGTTPPSVDVDRHETPPGNSCRHGKCPGGVLQCL